MEDRVNKRIEDSLREMFEVDYPEALRALALAKDYEGRNMREVGYMNFRDALHHLRTVLDTDEDPLRRFEHTACAREHLRRAAVEPHKIGLIHLYGKALESWESYFFRHYIDDLADGRPDMRPGAEALLDNARRLVKRCRAGHNGDEWAENALEVHECCEALRKLAEECAAPGL